MDDHALPDFLRSIGRPRLPNATRQMQTYLTCLFADEDVIEVLGGGLKPVYETIARFILYLDVRDRANRVNHANIFIGVNPRGPESAAAEQRILCARTLFAHFQGGSRQRTERAIVEANLPVPTLLVNSGHGFHAYWRLEEPLTDWVLWRSLQRQLMQRCGGTGEFTADPACVMRVPGFYNLKSDPVSCRITGADARLRFPICAFTA